MRRITTEELKQLQIGILDVVAAFCEEQNIHYWLDSGTLIGAVRHKGYIPWDDDIDIGMLREDYDRFIRLFNQREDTRYRLECVELNPKFYVPFGKVFDTTTVLYEPNENGQKLHVNIDVFVFDNAPDVDALVTEMYDRRDALQKRCYMQNRSEPPQGNPLVKCGKYLVRFGYWLLPHDGAKRLAENSKRFAGVPTKRVGNFMAWKRFACDRAVLSEFIDIPFEGKLYKAPARYDEWLRCIYGDYMQLPPEEERVTHHHFVAYIDNSSL